MTGRATHGHTKGRSTSPEFNSWLAMRQRCSDPKHEKFPTYGGAGVKVCDRWAASFEDFLTDMGPRPEGTTLDRYPNAKGNYEPGNCRWATYKEQAQNRAPFEHANTRKKSCPSGHRYNKANTRISKDGSRQCRVCDRVRARAVRGRHKQGAVAG